MKKSQLFTSMMVLALLSATSFGEVFTGIKGGGIIRQLWSPPLDFSGPTLGIGGGVFLRVKFHELFSLQPELLYIMKGGKESVFHKEANPLVGPMMETDTTTTNTAKIDYIEIPLLFKLYAPGFTANEPHLLLGPYFGYQISKSVEITQSGNRHGNIISIPPQPGNYDKNNDEKQAYGLVIGGGLDFGLGTFDIRYIISFSKINKEGDENPQSLTALAMFGFAF